MDKPVYAAKPIEVEFIEVVLLAVDNKIPTLIKTISFNKQTFATILQHDVYLLKMMIDH